MIIVQEKVEICFALLAYSVVICLKPLIVNARVISEYSFGFDVGEAVNKVTSQDGAIVKDILVVGVGVIIYFDNSIYLWRNPT